MKFRGKRALVSLSLLIALASGVGATPAHADPVLIDTLDNSTVIGNYTFSVTIPALDPDFGDAHMEIVPQWGNPTVGFAVSLPIRDAGTYTYTINPFGTQDQLTSQFGTGSQAFNVMGNPANVLVPGVAQVDFEYQVDSSSPVVRQLLTHITFKAACAAGTYSQDGGRPIGGACDPAPIGSYVNFPGATSATPCPGSQTTSGMSATSISACHRSTTPSPTLNIPIQDTTSVGNLTVRYTLTDEANSGSAQIVISNADYSRTITLLNTSVGTFSVTFNPLVANSALMSGHSVEFANVTTSHNSQAFANSLPIGNYTVRFQYQDIFANPFNGAQATNVLLTTPCDPGSFSASGTKDAQGSCTATSRGHFTSAPGAQSEQPCAKGSYAAEVGAWRCVLAAPNTYVATEGASTSTPCPSKYTSPQGSDALSDCKKPVVAVKYCNIKKGKKATASCIAIAASKTIPAKAKVSITVNKSDKKFCVVKSGQVFGKAKGICRVTLKVQPKKGKAVTYSSRIRVS
jgi:hypothetical protein